MMPKWKRQGEKKMSKKSIYDFLISQGLNKYGACGLIANIERESGCNPKNLQNTGNKKLNMTDEEYTEAVDSGKYTKTQFMADSQGYGLAQWTYFSRKGALYDYAKRSSRSIGDLQMQLEFLLAEIKLYKGVWQVLKVATSLRETTETVMLQYERPADQSETAIAKRCAIAEQFYNEFCPEEVTVQMPVLKRGAKGYCVKVLQILLKGLGYDCGEVDESFGPKVETAVKKFQEEHGFEKDGMVGVDTWDLLLN